MVPESVDPLGNLEQALYKQGEAPGPVRRSRLSAAPLGAPPSWADPPFRRIAESRWLGTGFLRKLVLVAITFFIIMAGLAAWVFLRGSNQISAGNVDLKLTLPERAKSGEEITLGVAVTNKNNAALEFVDLIIEYPRGVQAVGTGVELGRQRESLGTIKPGQTVERQLRSVLYGEKDQELSIPVAIEYRLADSNAIFSKQTSATVKLNDSPLALVVNVPSEIDANEDVALVFEVSPGDTAIQNVLAVMTYPPGFTFKTATPPPTSGENVWRFDTIKSGERKRVRVVGSLQGENEEQKPFRVAVGTPDKSDQDKIGVTYSSVLETVAIKKPEIGLTVSVNGSTLAEQVASPRDVIKVEIEWANNLSSEITDAEVAVAFNGRALDTRSVAPAQGFYQSSGNKAIWNKTSDRDLGSISSGETGKVELTFSSVSLAEAGIKNPQIDLGVTFRGKTNTERSTGVLVSSQATRTIRLNSVLQLAAKALYHTGPLVNSGPVPPQVGRETVYTVVWSVVNSSNDVGDAQVVATLPPYVRWVGAQAPPSESLVFRGASGGGGELAWNLGTVKAGSGFATAAREVAFQVALSPSLSQVGDAPTLVQDPTLTGTDLFTRESLGGRAARSLDTYLANDPDFKAGEDKVVE